VFFNTKTLEVIKTIPARGADGYIFDAQNHHFLILSHNAPNLLVIDSKDGSVVKSVAAIGPNGANAAVEQGASDGEGHLFFDCSTVVAVVDAKTLEVTGHYDLGGATSAAGLAIDAKNHILFAMCRGGASGAGPTCVILSSVDGKIITTLPLAGGSDGGGFNPNTMEAFSSTGNNGKNTGALTIIKEKSPTEFVVEDNVETKSGAKTCTLDAKLDHIIVITQEAAPAPAAAAASGSASAPAASAAPAAASAPAGSAGAVASDAASGRGGRAGGGRAGGGRGPAGPQLLDVIFVGR